MKLKLTDTEFAILMEMVYAGNWVINGCRLPDDIVSPYLEMLNQLLDIYAARNKAKDMRSYDLNAFFDARLQKYFDFFAEHTMHLTLAREYVKKNRIGDAKKVSEAQDAYHGELTANGLKNVEIIIEKNNCLDNAT